MALAVLAAEPGNVHPGATAPGVKALEAPGLHNLFALVTNVLSGSSPEGEEGFAALKKLGVKTIISVDGAKPDIVAARQWGLRYVHLPHGYDGISSNLQLRLARAAQELPGPIYVHCHHGKHRGPTAAAVLCLAQDGWNSAQAESWLRLAGTATHYTGLYEVVRTFHQPTPEQIRSVPPEFPEVAAVSGLVETMVEVDERWDHLKQVRAAGYQVPREHPDLKPAHEAVMLWEHYREARRLPESARRGADFIDRLAMAEAEAHEAERLLRLFAAEPKDELRPKLDQAFDAIGKTCSSCHLSHRDSAGTGKAE